VVAMMDTLAIYEQFRAVLGEERAKGFAQTLGTMIEEAKNAATKEDIRLLRESLDAGISNLDVALAKLAEAQARTEVRVGGLEERMGRLEEVVQKLAEAQVRTEERVGGLELRMGRLEEVMQKLAEAQARTEVRVGGLEEAMQKLAEAQARTEERVGGLEERMGRLEEVMQKLAEAQARTEERLVRLEVVIEKLIVRSDRHEGKLLELSFRERLPSYLGLFLRRAKVLQPADLLDELEPRLDRAEVEDFLRADVLARGAVDGQPTYVVGEVSYTAHASDVERAARRAALVRKADLPAVGLVACETVQPETLAYAREQRVRVWADGRFVD
jgi:chromosome segregation ATPase